MALKMRRPDRINFELPCGGHVTHFTEGMNGPIPETTDEERELVCNALDKRGLWVTDLPKILGLVDRK